MCCAVSSLFAMVAAIEGTKSCHEIEICIVKLTNFVIENHHFLSGKKAIILISQPSFWFQLAIDRRLMISEASGLNAILRWKLLPKANFRH